MIVPGFAPPGRLPRAVDSRARELFAEVSAAVGGEPAGGWVDLAGPLPETPHSAAAVLSLCALSVAGDPTARLAAAKRALAPDGRLVLIEPYRRPGWAGRIADLAAAPVHARYGLWCNRPVPSLVRGAGFVIGQIERFLMPTPVLPLRPFVVIVATVADGDGRA